MRHESRDLRRRAFTLTEILVVIAIIGLLSSLAAWGVFAMIGNTQRNTTNATMRVVNKMLQDRWTAVIADSRKEPASPAVVNLAGGAVLDPTGERAKVIWTKVRLVEAFPVLYAEVAAANAGSVVNLYIPANRRKPYFAKYQQALSGLTAGTPGESSACLLLALKTLYPDGVAIDDQIKYAVANNDGDGASLVPVPNTIPTLVDGWQKPMAFFRFPFGGAADPGLQLANPGKNTVNGAKFADPIDTGGTLLNPKWYTSATTVPPAALTLKTTYESLFHVIGPPAVPTPAAAYYVAPVIVSGGKDNAIQLGLVVMNILPNLPSGAGAGDNIYSFNLRAD